MAFDLRFARRCSRAALPLLFAPLLALVGCQAPLKNTVDVEALIASSPDADYVSGRALGLGEPEVLNDKDFVYAVAFDDASSEVAFVHHVTTDMELTVSTVDPAAERFRTPVNHHRYDVEDVVFLERGAAGRFVVTPSRQGIVRRFRASDGAAAGELIYGQPLLRVAVNPSETLLALGSADGRVLLLDAVTLAFRGEAHPHKDEVQGVAFLDDRRLLTTSFDGTLVESRIEPGAPEVFSVPSTKLEGSALAFLAHLDGVKAVTTVRDLRQPSHAISTAAVARLGLKPALDAEPLIVVTPLGPQPRPAVELGDLQVRYLSFGPQLAAVCDECVPEGAELVLGRPAHVRATFGDDFAAGETLVKSLGTSAGAIPKAAPAPAPVETAPPPVEGAPALAPPAAAAPVEPAPVEPAPVEPALPLPGSLVLVEQRRLSLPGPGTDVDVDGRARRAVVAYSHARAERNPDLYQAEKDGIYPPPSPASGAVIVDLAKWELGRRLIGHEGFTVTAAISPDGKTVVSGGWDKRFLVFDVESGKQITERELAWLLRRVRFSPDGRFLAAAAWTPTNPIGEGHSDPALLIYPVVFEDPTTTSGARAVSQAN